LSIYIFSSQRLKYFYRNFTTNNNTIPHQLLTTTTEQQQQQNQTQPELNSINEADPWSGQSGRALLRHLLCSEEKISNMRDTVVAHACTLQYSTRGVIFWGEIIPPYLKGYLELIVKTIFVFEERPIKNYFPIRKLYGDELEGTYWNLATGLDSLIFY